MFDLSAARNPHRLPRRLAHAFVWALGWWVTAAAVVGVLVGSYASLRTLRPRPSAPGDARAGVTS